MIITTNGLHALYLNKPSREGVVLLASGEFDNAIVTAGYLNTSEEFQAFVDGNIESGVGYEFVTAGIPVVIKVEGKGALTSIDLIASGL
jgi:hypothetical protein